MELTCEECGESFSVGAGRRGVLPRVCGPGCRRARRTRLNKEKTSRVREPSSVTEEGTLFPLQIELAPKTLVCMKCGREFDKPPHATRNPGYCSEVCRKAGRTERTRLNNARVAAEVATGLRVRTYRSVADEHPLARRVEELTCVECGNDFPRGTSRKPPLTCGVECKKKRKAHQVRVLNAAKRVARLAERAQRDLDDPPAPPPGPSVIICSECHEEFTVDRPTNRVGALPMTCSDGCRKTRKYRVARERAAILSDCEVEGCGRRRWTPGVPWCTMHYSRSQTYGDPRAEPTRRKANGTCHRCEKEAASSHLFCSAACRREDERLHVSAGSFTECQTCGKPNEGPPSQRFCSDHCYKFFERARKYGVAPHELKEILGEEGRCAICSRPDADHVDHDHVTGRIRGLLCSQCNVGLGMFQDSPMLLANAVNYLHS